MNTGPHERSLAQIALPLLLPSTSLSGKVSFKTYQFNQLILVTNYDLIGLSKQRRQT